MAKSPDEGDFFGFGGILQRCRSSPMANPKAKSNPTNSSNRFSASCWGLYHLDISGFYRMMTLFFCKVLSVKMKGFFVDLFRDTKFRHKMGYCWAMQGSYCIDGWVRPCHGRTNADGAFGYLQWNPRMIPASNQMRFQSVSFSTRFGALVSSAGRQNQAASKVMIGLEPMTVVYPKNRWTCSRIKKEAAIATGDLWSD